MRRITTIEEVQYVGFCHTCEWWVNASPKGWLLPHRRPSIHGKSEWCPGASQIANVRPSGRKIIRDVES